MFNPARGPCRFQQLPSPPRSPCPGSPLWETKAASRSQSPKSFPRRKPISLFLFRLQRPWLRGARWAHSSGMGRARPPAPRPPPDCSLFQAEQEAVWGEGRGLGRGLALAETYKALNPPCSHKTLSLHQADRRPGSAAPTPPQTGKVVLHQTFSLRIGTSLT